MKIFISQPTFFPWLGYFDMIDQVDKFIILDDVDFSYQSWQHRNNFKTPNGLGFFTVPVGFALIASWIEGEGVIRPES